MNAYKTAPMCAKVTFRSGFSNLFANTLTMTSTKDLSVWKCKLWCEESMTAAVKSIHGNGKGHIIYGC